MNLRLGVNTNYVVYPLHDCSKDEQRDACSHVNFQRSIFAMF